MNNRLKLTLLSLTVAYTPNLLAAEMVIPCEKSFVFCMEEFEAIADQSKSIEAMIPMLPEHVKKNMTLKRGNNIEKTINGMTTTVGPHGHLAPSNDSSSATPGQPRVFVWDEKSGFTASWNSGNPAHSGANRVDLYDFDFKTNKHRLMGWEAQNGFMDAHAPMDSSGRSCVTCHGEAQRPIFPMYPDWPQFFGEFNDEMSGYAKDAKALRSDLKILANEFQPKEKKLYFDFLDLEGMTNPRYTPLYAVKPDDDNQYYPFRPRTTTSPFSDVSRAFAHRPNLRLGVLYNRLTALQVFEKLKQSPVFKKFPDMMFYALLDCNWTAGGMAERTQYLNTLLAGAGELDAKYKTLNLRGAMFSEDDIKGMDKANFKEAVVGGKKVYYKHGKYDESGYAQIPYEDLLKLFDLNLADMDIRFAHNSSLKGGNFNVYDPRAHYFTNSVMDIGYIQDKYKLNPICDNNGTPCNFAYKADSYMQGLKYFNSYFDGSATMNELLAAQILIYLTDAKQDFSKEPALAAVRTMLKKSIPDATIYFETLRKKYKNFEERLKLDDVFFSRMDGLSPWLQLPYPDDLINTHNRESFWTKGATPIRMRHAQWLTLKDRKDGVQNRNGGNNICWNVYDSMKARYIKK